MEEISTIGLDLAKHVFQAHGRAHAATPAHLRRQRRRALGQAQGGPARLLAGTHARAQPPMLVIVALANKNARVAWALITKGGIYRAPAAAA
jgi:hypothetical protein